jgi:putative addiction module CopG family antidote
VHISLTPELKKFVEDAVRSGYYLNANEVVRAALRSLKAEEARTVRPLKGLEEVEAHIRAALVKVDPNTSGQTKEVLEELLREIRLADALR